MTDTPLEYGRETVTRRRYWLRKTWRWLWRTTAVLAGVVVIVHTIWLVRATSALNREVAALAAAGEPTTPAALQPVVPPGNNAFTLFESAGKVIKPETLASRRLNAFAPQPPLFDLERRRLQAYVDERAAALPWLEQALVAPVNVTTVRLSSPLINVLLPQLGEQRSVATFQKYQVLLAHDRGNDDEALRLAGGLDKVALSAGSSPFLVCRLVATGIRAIHADLLHDMIPTLRIGTAAGDASPARVRQTIAELLDARPLDAEQQTAFRGERLFVLDMLQCIDTGATHNVVLPTLMPTSWAALRYVQRPYVRSNAATSLRIGNARLVAVGAPDWPTAQARLSATGITPQSYNFTMNFYVHLLVGSLDRAVMVDYHIRTDRRLAAVALAARWHECELGRRPATWADLVPKYLPAIPDDPMAANRPLQARFTGPDPIVWGVGDNAVDEFACERTKGRYPGPWESLDRVQHLVPPPRVAEAELKQLIDLDLDAPLAVDPAPPSPTTTQPSQAQPSNLPTPDWTTVNRLTITAMSAPPANLATRRDLFALLATSIDAVAPPPTPAPPPATAATIAGHITSPDGTWQFTLHTNGDLIIVAPDGTAWPRVANPSATPTGREFWE